MLIPLNTEWNRKTGILPGNGQVSLLGAKHGITYFIWTAQGGTITFLQCDELVFKKHFKFPVNGLPEFAKVGDADLDTLLKKKTKFLKYPFDVLL